MRMRDAPWAHRVYMGNLPFDMEAEDIAAFFRDKVGWLLAMCVWVSVCFGQGKVGWLIDGISGDRTVSRGGGSLCVQACDCVCVSRIAAACVDMDGGHDNAPSPLASINTT